jgi:hypothetical protein
MDVKRTLCFLAAWLPVVVWAQQVIVIDDAHLQMGPGTPPTYKIKPATSIVIDARHYTFQAPEALKDKPINHVLVVISKQQYSADWNPTAAQATLSSGTLRALNGGVPFAGFTPHQKVVIAIGNLVGRDFGVVWAGLVDVD